MIIWREFHNILGHAFVIPMSLSTRRMLTLYEDSSLNKEEIWLKRAYGNIVYGLIEPTLTLTTSSKFDPFESKFMGIDSVVSDKFQYQAILETTSHFWASKGERGTLLEKIMASLGNSCSSNSVTLSMITSVESSLNFAPIQWILISSRS